MRLRKNKWMALMLSASLAVSALAPAVYAEEVTADVAEEAFFEEDEEVLFEEGEEYAEEEIEAITEGSASDELETVDVVDSIDEIDADELFIDEEIEEIAEVEAEEEYADGTYSLAKISSSFRMFTISSPATLVIDGENAILILYGLSGGESASKRYSEIYIGAYEDITEENKDTVGIKGTDTNQGLQFIIPLKSSDLASDTKIPYVIRYRKGYSADHDGDWYAASTPATITLGEFDKKSDETELPAADYSAVDAALEKIPSDLDGYTEETVAAVNTAKNAVVRDKKIDAQAEVDAMAKAIEDAVNALAKISKLGDGVYTLPGLKSGPGEMFNHFETDSRFLIVDGDTATIRFITDATTASIAKYSKIALGKASELVETAYAQSLAKDVPIIEGVELAKEGDNGSRYLFEVPLAKAAVEELLANDIEEDIYIAIYNKVGSSKEKIPGWYKSSSDFYLSLGTLGEKTEAPTDEPLLKKLEDGVYTLPELKSGPGDMFNHFETGSRYVFVDGNTATIRFITDATTASIAKYSKIALGKASELVASPYAQTLEKDATIIEGIELAQDGEKGSRYLYEIPLEKEKVERLLSNEIDEDIYITIYNKVGSTNDKIPGWYQSSSDFYLSLGAIGERAEKPVDEPFKPIATNLSIYNEELMYKVVNAYIEKTGKKTELVFALSGKNYEDVFAGTYDEAVANGANKDNWVKYSLATVECVYANASGTQNDGLQEKYQFRIPVTLNATGTTRVPLVAISLPKVKAAEEANPSAPDYKDAFYPRQFVIDIDAKTVRTGNYQDTIEAAVTSSIKSMKVEVKGEIFTIGMPTMNEYTRQGTFTLSDTTYDAYFKGTAADAATVADGITKIGEDKVVTLTYLNSYRKDPEIDVTTGKVNVAFRAAETQKWYDREIVIDPDTKTIIISGEELPAATPTEPTKPADEVKVPESVFPAVGTKLTASGVSYKVTAAGSEVEYTAPSKSAKSVTIPETVKIDNVTYKVTSVAAKAFKGNTKVTTVTIGKNVTKIGASAFAGTKNLKKVTIKSTSIKTIGKKAFSKAGSKNYKKLTVKVPKSKLKAYKKLLKSAKLSAKAKVK